MECKEGGQFNMRLDPLRTYLAILYRGPHKADMMYVDVTEEAKEEKKKGK